MNVSKNEAHLEASGGLIPYYPEEQGGQQKDGQEGFHTTLFSILDTVLRSP